MGVLRSGARGNMPATAKRLASWRVLKEMLQSFLRRCSLLDVLESLTVGTCVQHFFQVLSRGGGSLAQVFACPGHNFFFPCPILRFACPVFVDKCKVSRFDRKTLRGCTACSGGCSLLLGGANGKGVHISFAVSSKAR